MKKSISSCMIVSLFLLLFTFNNVFAYDACDPNTPAVPCQKSTGGTADAVLGDSIHIAFVDTNEFNLIDAQYVVWVNIKDNPSKGLLYEFTNGQWNLFNGNGIFGSTGIYRYWNNLFWYGTGGTNLLTVTLNPQAGGTVTSNPASDFSCANGTCTGNFSGNITTTASANSGYQFVNWLESGTVISNNCPATTLNLTMSCARSITAQFVPEATDFVYPVLKAGVTDPLQNKADPDENGWHGIGLGEQGINDAYGHLGQDYVMDSNNGDGDAAGEPVYAVANGIIVEVTNNQSTSYGWCDNGDHGWGPVVVIKHVKASGFDTTDSIVTSTCGTETNPTVVYSLYGHLSKTSIQGLSVGQIVTKGQQIGVLGAEGTDWSEEMANHLHFELKDEAGFNEGTWYTSHAGQCPGSIAYTLCSGITMRGIGTAYSHASGFAPHHYIPGIFISTNQQ